jgi:acid phosphatase (class A)
MLRPIRIFWLLALLLLPQYLWAETPPYLGQTHVDLVMLLAPPPAMDSQAQAKEMNMLMTLQDNRTPAQAAKAKADQQRTVFQFGNILGPDFTAEKLPKAAEFFDKARKTADDILDPAKAFWNRPRPYTANPDIHPCVDKPNNASYPSGHSTFGTVMAVLLANMLPEKKTELFIRADEYGFERNIGGVHYPTDVAAGRIAGTVIAAFMFADPQFKTDFEQAKAEVRAVLGMK